MRIPILLISLFQLFNCSTLQADFYSEAARLNKKCANYLSKNLGVSVYGMGSSMPNDIHNFSISTIKSAHVTVPQARKMFVFGVESMKKIINSNKEIRPYLHSYPCTMKETYFTIRFEKPSENYPPPEYIAKVRPYKNGQVVYENYDPVTRSKKIIHVESYEEALKIVQKSNIMRNEP